MSRELNNAGTQAAGNGETHSKDEPDTDEQNWKSLQNKRAHR